MKCFLKKVYVLTFYFRKIVLPSFHKIVINVSWKSWIEECAFRNNFIPLHCTSTMITWSVYEFLLSCLHGLLFSYLQIFVTLHKFLSWIISHFCQMKYIFQENFKNFFEGYSNKKLKQVYCWANFCNFMLMCRFKNCQRKNQPPDGSKEFA